jgi:hypothetical protein
MVDNFLFCEMFFVFVVVFCGFVLFLSSNKKKSEEAVRTKEAPWQAKESSRIQAPTLTQ